MTFPESNFLWSVTRRYTENNTVALIIFEEYKKVRFKSVYITRKYYPGDLC